MKTIALVLAAALAAGCTHSAAVQMRYVGIVPIVGGGLLAAEPNVTARGTEEAGLGIALGGVALIVLSCIVDPQGC